MVSITHVHDTSVRTAPNLDKSRAISHLVNIDPTWHTSRSHKSRCYDVGANRTLGVTHIYLPKTDLSRLTLLAPRRMCGNADLLNAHGGCGRWIEHDYRNRKVRRKHVELLRLADIDGILTRVVADTHASAHTQQFGNRHMIRSCGEQSSASRCCRIGLGLAGRVQTRE